MLTNHELEVLAAKVWRMRRMAPGRGIDLSNTHHTDLVEEAFDLARRLGSPIPFVAARTAYPVERLGVNGEPEIDGVPRALMDLLS